MAFDLAVVIQTVCRPTVVRSLDSIFKQTHPGPLQVLIGVDKGMDDTLIREFIRANRPPHVVCNIINLGFSNATAQGGVYSNAFGGSLRTSLTFLANSKYVAFLDDEDWWDPGHVADILAALQKADWAYAFRNYVNSANNEVIAQDRWESVGPGQGFFNERFGGFVCCSALALNKITLAPLLHLFCFAMFPTGDGEDRQFLHGLFKSGAKGAATNRASVMCAVNPGDKMHARRLQWWEQSGYDVSKIPTQAYPRGTDFRPA
ncbi:MAG: glycosyltransferase family 2 protein [Nevskia sp.]|nr:glycosyltransferase family 2 protein [Nevskia sp.]